MIMGSPADPSQNVIFLFLDENGEQITEEGVFPDTNVWDVYQAEERTNERGEAVIVRHCRKYTDQEINIRKEQQKLSEMLAAAVLVAQFQAQSLPDEQAVAVKSIYPAYDPNGVKYPVDYKVLQADVLYKCLQEHISQENRAPGIAPSIWVAVETGEHAGTLEDPIPVPDTVKTAGMEYEYGKYYSEGGTVYLCKRSGVEDPESMYGQKERLYFPPSALIGQYFVTV